MLLPGFLLAVVLWAPVAPVLAAELPLAEDLIREEERPENPGLVPRTQGLPVELSGYWEARAGVRTRNDPYQRDMSLGETRFQLRLEREWEAASVILTGDLLYDPVPDRHDIRLEEGEGWLDLREANLSFTPWDFMDVKAGRQVVTWGTGDLLFLNDLFPKDWNAFFIGRDQEYLKAPSDALKVSLYAGLANLDIVYSPCFDADRYIDGRRISYWNGVLGRLAGRDAPVQAERRHDWFSDDELAVRLFRSVGRYEVATYGYCGFWKSPGGMDTRSGKVMFPKLSVYGGSARGGCGEGDR